jgi:uncharacterized protein YcaQ
VLQLSPTEARRLPVAAQLLSAPRPTDLVATIHHLGAVQVDPTNAVARTERLVLWSRLGAYDTAALERATFADRELFEYWVYLVPTTDYPLHRDTMRRYPRDTTTRGRYIRAWLAANAGFRRYVLRTVRRRGPVRSRDLEDRAAVPWSTGGWNDGKNVGRMLDALWFVEGSASSAARATSGSGTSPIAATRSARHGFLRPRWPRPSWNGSSRAAVSPVAASSAWPSTGGRRAGSGRSGRW